MNPRRLRYFVALAEELHFGRAAKKLNVSQPALSEQIKGLESELHTTLFERGVRDIRLTDTGLTLLKDARSILVMIEDAAERVQRVEQAEDGHMRIGFVSIALYNILPGVIRRFRSSHPNVRLDLEEATTGNLVVEVSECRMEVALVVAPIRHPGLAYRPLVREPLILALHEDCPLGKLESELSLARAANEPYILFPRRLGPGVYDKVYAFCAAAGFRPTVVQEAIQMQTIVSLVAAGMGVALVPASVQQLKRPGVVYRTLLEPSPLIEMGFIHGKGHLSAAAKALLQDLEKLVPLSCSLGSAVAPCAEAMLA